MTNERRKQIRKARRKKDKNRIVKWFQGLSKKKKAAIIIVAVLLVLMIVAVLFVASKFAKLDTEEIPEEEIVINDFEEEEVGVGYTNFVLFGGDSRKGSVDGDLNTDTIIVASLNNETKEVKLVSVYRDTLLDLGNGRIAKCNGAYAAGGAKQAINMLNMNLDLDIKKYVTVDFGAVAELVDMLGGIEADISQAEMNAMNQYIWETATVAGKKANLITHTGPQTMDGVQATTYARIRKGVGDDYKRTERQRYVIQKVVEKGLKSDLGTINKIIDKLFPQVSTNFTMGEILDYAKDFSKYKIGETTGFPIEKGSGTVPGRGSSVFPITLKKNVSLLHEFLYGTENYQPSSKVVSISGEIAYIVGNRQVEPNTSWQDNGQTNTGTGTTGTGTNTDGTNPDSTNPDGTTPDGGGSGTGDGSGNTGGDNGNTGGDSGNTGGDSGNTGGDSGNTGGDSGNTGGDSGNTDGNGGNAGEDSGNTGEDNGNTGGDSGATGATGDTVQ